VDPRVRGIIAANAAKLANETADYTCDKPCQSNNKVEAGGCCDGACVCGRCGVELSAATGCLSVSPALPVPHPHHPPTTPPQSGVWQPYIAFSNLKYLPQDRVVRYGFGFDPNSDAVFQWRSVHAGGQGWRSRCRIGGSACAAVQRVPCCASLR
jgi:hypothetical protein